MTTEDMDDYHLKVTITGDITEEVVGTTSLISYRQTEMHLSCCYMNLTKRSPDIPSGKDEKSLRLSIKCFTPKRSSEWE